MSFEVLQEKKPSCSVGAMGLIIALSLVLLGTGVAFAYQFVNGGNDYLLGTLLAAEFLIIDVLLVLYAKNFVAFRQVAEDREERLLW